MTQPDLVSKLRELSAKWRKQATWEHNHSVKQRDAGDLDDEGYITARARMFQLEECSDSLESLLGREGQAAEPDFGTAEEVIAGLDSIIAHNSDVALAHSAFLSPSTPIQPEPSRSVQRREALQKGELMPTFEPSTPIVPGTAGLSADWPECKEFYDLMQYYRHAPVSKRLIHGKRYEAVKEWLRAQVNALLGAAKPAEPEPIYTHFDPQTHVVTVIPASVEARIRKDVLEEAARFVESTDVDVVYRYTPFPHNDELTSKPLAELARRIRALAERPAPAGEVKGEK